MQVKKRRGGVHGNFYWNAALLDIGKMVPVQMFPTSILNGGSQTVNLPTISFVVMNRRLDFAQTP